MLFPLLRMLFPQIFMYLEWCLEWNIGRASEIEHVRRVKTKTSLIGSKLDWLKRKLKREDGDEVVKTSNCFTPENLG